MNEKELAAVEAELERQRDIAWILSLNPARLLRLAKEVQKRKLNEQENSVKPN